MDKKQSICIIGAGMSGIVAAKHLDASGINFEWHEKTTEAGGIWCYRQTDDVMSIYDCCHTIGCKRNMGFSDFPPPKAMPEYPSHREYSRYLNAYIDHFKLRQKIQFESTITQVHPMLPGFKVIFANGDEKHFDGIIVTSGQFNQPKYPDFSGEFAGEAIHSAFYRTAEKYRDKNVLLVGLGNSGIDIACDVAKVANNTYLSTRESAHIIPKYILGLPFLRYHSPIDDYLPFFISQMLTRLLAFLGRGRLSSYNFPKPKRQVLLKNPAMSDTILNAVKTGQVQMKPGVESLTKTGAKFTDDSEIEVDHIIYTTGYDTCFPFFDEELIAFKPGKLNNYLHVANIDHPQLFFMGIVDPFGTFPLVLENQAKMICALLNQQCELPDKSYMQANMQAYEKKMRKLLHDQSNKPMIKEKFYLYQHKLQRFIKKYKSNSTSHSLEQK